VQMRTEIRELHQRLKVTTVYVTHDQIEAMTMADRIVVMRDGHIAQIGAPLALYDRPANVFVAGFIGSPAMNLIPGVIRDRDGHRRIETAGGLMLAAPDLAGLDEGRRVIFGIRPEDLDLDVAGIGATISVIEPTGAETHVVLRAAGAGSGSGSGQGQEITAIFRERHDFRPGDLLHLRPRPEKVHIFDAEDGTRIG